MKGFRGAGLLVSDGKHYVVGLFFLHEVQGIAALNYRTRLGAALVDSIGHTKDCGFIPPPGDARHHNGLSNALRKTLKPQGLPSGTSQIEANDVAVSYNGLEDGPIAEIDQIPGGLCLPNRAGKPVFGVGLLRVADASYVGQLAVPTLNEFCPGTEVGVLHNEVLWALLACGEDQQGEQ